MHYAVNGAVASVRSDVQARIARWPSLEPDATKVSGHIIILEQCHVAPSSGLFEYLRIIFLFIIEMQPQYEVASFMVHNSNLPQTKCLLAALGSANIMIST